MRERIRYKEDREGSEDLHKEEESEEPPQKGEKREVNVWSLPGGRRGGRLLTR